MAVVEGRGRVKPAPIVVSLTTEQIVTLYRESMRRREHRFDYGFRNQWKRGNTGNRVILGHTLDNVAAPIFAGLMGEYATCRAINNRVHLANVKQDFSLNDGDDGTDLFACGIRIQVKTRVSRGRSETLVRRITTRGDGMKILPLNFDSLVCCEYSFDDSCQVLGWVSRKTLSAKHIKRSQISNKWLNLVVSDVELQPMSRLFDWIVSEVKR